MAENTLGALLPEMRLDFWDALWEGQIAGAAVLRRRLKVLELPVQEDSPCCRCVLRLRHGDAYLDQIWRYGRNRLRVAVGNLLPRDHGVLYGICRLTTHHVYILACAMDGTDAATLEDIARRDIAQLIDALENYLDLESELKEIVPMQSLKALTREGEGK